ncbi:MAG: chemotaxis response regulator protein-glutamate methylesterase [Granulosicoccaceae bacterium]
MTRKYKVLIVDDSLSICKFLEKVLSMDADLEVVGIALDPYEARDKIKQLLPDVLTLDVEMPKMDGLTFLKNIMRLRPMPVVMISSLTAAGAQVTLDALQIGAVDFMVKKHPGSQDDLDAYASEITTRVKDAARMSISQLGEPLATLDCGDIKALKDKLDSGSNATRSIKRMVAIGASTGGPEAFRHVLSSFYSPDCAVAICQHMPDRFMEPFAQRLNKASKFQIALAEDGEQIRSGCGYVAPGERHLVIMRKNADLFCKLIPSDRVSGHRPSVDVLFESVAESVANGCVGVLLTGMGEDGAKGLTRLRQQGAATVVQDKQSSAVWGMPGRAFEMGGADQVLSLQHIAPSLNKVLNRAA